jgi:hypothetical protein
VVAVVCRGPALPQIRPTVLAAKIAVAAVARTIRFRHLHINLPMNDCTPMLARREMLP